MAKQQPKSGVGLIAAARAEQIFQHGHNLTSDSKYLSRDVFQKAAVAIIHSNRKEWPEGHMPIDVLNKILNKPRPEQLAVAGSFLAAEIDYMTLKEYNHTVAQADGQTDPDVIGLVNPIQPITNEIASLDAVATDGFRIPNSRISAVGWKKEHDNKNILYNMVEMALQERMNSFEVEHRKAMWRVEISPIPAVPAPMSGKRESTIEKLFADQVKSGTRPYFGIPPHIRVARDFMYGKGKEAADIFDNQQKLKTWQKEQAVLSETILKSPTDFLRDKGFIHDNNSVFFVVVKRSEGMEHVNLAQLLEDYCDYNASKKGKNINFDLSLQDRMSSSMKDLNKAGADLLQYLMHKDVFNAYYGATKKAMTIDGAIRDGDVLKKIKTNMEQVWTDLRKHVSLPMSKMSDAYRKDQIDFANTDYKSASEWLREQNYMKGKAIILDRGGWYMNLAGVLTDYHNYACETMEVPPRLFQANKDGWKGRCAKLEHDVALWKDKYDAINSLYAAITISNRENANKLDHVFICAGDDFDSVQKKVKQLHAHYIPGLGDNFFILMGDISKQLTNYQNLHDHFKQKLNDATRSNNARVVSSAIQSMWEDYCEDGTAFEGDPSIKRSFGEYLANAGMLKLEGVPARKSAADPNYSTPLKRRLQKLVEEWQLDPETKGRGFYAWLGSRGYVEYIPVSDLIVKAANKLKEKIGNFVGQSNNEDAHRALHQITVNELAEEEAFTPNRKKAKKKK